MIVQLKYSLSSLLPPYFPPFAGFKGEEGRQKHKLKSEQKLCFPVKEHRSQTASDSLISGKSCIFNLLHFHAKNSLFGRFLFGNKSSPFIMGRMSVYICKTFQWNKRCVSNSWNDSFQRIPHSTIHNPHIFKKWLLKVEAGSSFLGLTLIDSD